VTGSVAAIEGADGDVVVAAQQREARDLEGDRDTTFDGPERRVGPKAALAALVAD